MATWGAIFIAIWGTIFAAIWCADFYGGGKSRVWATCDLTARGFGNSGRRPIAGVLSIFKLNCGLAAIFVAVKSPLVYHNESNISNYIEPCICGISGDNHNYILNQYLLALKLYTSLDTILSGLMWQVHY